MELEKRKRTHAILNKGGALMDNDRAPVIFQKETKNGLKKVVL
jgi:hypothetical protein